MDERLVFHPITLIQDIIIKICMGQRGTNIYNTTWALDIPYLSYYYSLRVTLYAVLPKK